MRRQRSSDTSAPLASAISTARLTALQAETFE
jgi:hypothetical protein